MSPPQSQTTPSPSSSSKDSNGITFTINHMNTSHRDSLTYYLRVYNNVSPSEASTATLESITLQDLIIRTANANRYIVPFDPPLQSFSETRARLVAMHRDCLAQLGLSDTKITNYQFPSTPLEILIFLVCLSGLVAFTRREHFLPGGWVYEGLRLGSGWWWPRGFAAFCAMMQPFVLRFLVTVHAGEAAWLAYSRLRRHGVGFAGFVWWAWLVSTFVEGAQGFKRFDRLVASKEGEGKRK
ncbi:DUF2470 domain-containing protein [Aspergillus homomorphus CBS 101889]|uniref:Putative integral membrane protein n=1 Tax=Aspergillus homomorphus (strain CBS 101889) TaxID=1450537 RepID=A0A395HQD4_ASPHC|nr:putative integral membrane protein [Aspergillus homomorphus CBS 101889]RAL09816.1 putative integral membrane protein [Aspergillus homomorphus CBS 101889]